MPTFNTPFGPLNRLIRQPEQTGTPLQAFDAADEYLLNALQAQALSPQHRVLILNDQFGALACALAGQAEILSSGDSYLAHQALLKNLARHHRPDAEVRFIPATQTPEGLFDFVLIRIPKTLSLLEEQAIRLRTHLASNATLLAGAMVKHLTPAASTVLAKHLGSVQASLAVKKARILQVTPQEPCSDSPSPYPSWYNLEQPPIQLSNHAGVFSRSGLDIGSRFFLAHLPSKNGPLRVADLGCGNGVLGICYALRHPQAELTFVDESYMAVQSAGENWQRIFGQRPATFKADDGLIGQLPQSLDLVLCNPPFHQQQVVGDFLARRMFQQAQKALVSGGELWVVGNRHLKHYHSLKSLFGSVESVASNAKFVVLKATRS